MTTTNRRRPFGHLEVIGIDPSPRKPSYLYSIDNGLCKKVASELREFLAELVASHRNVLICWDSPLTGTSAPDSNEFSSDDHTQRAIEAFFNRQGWGFKVPKGVSVRGYAGCPHWTISRRLIGLPRVGPWDKALRDLPFELVAKGSCPSRPGRYIVEVHPAVALWLWCDAPTWTGSWEYKKNGAVRKQAWARFKERLQNTPLLSGTSLDDLNFQPENDDELDCFIAWLLGVLWCQGSAEVILLGNAVTGSMLLPRVDRLEKRFLEFTRSLSYSTGVSEG